MQVLAIMNEWLISVAGRVQQYNFINLYMKIMSRKSMSCYRKGFRNAGF